MSDAEKHPRRSAELQALLDEIEAEEARSRVRAEGVPAAPAPPEADAVVAEAAMAAPAAPQPSVGATSPVVARSPRRSRRALFLAGGAAAAVVTIVAISVGGSSDRSDPGDVPKTSVGVAVVGSTGPDGHTTPVITTAPMTTNGGRAVVIVTGTDGDTHQVPTMTPSATTPGATRLLVLGTESSSQPPTAGRTTAEPSATNS